MIGALQSFVDVCIERLGGNRLSGILHYGSSARKENSLLSDCDVLCTVRQYDLALMQELNQILKQAVLLLDLSVVFESELPTNPDNFRIINHGCYFLEVMKNSIVLYGRNIFLELPSASQAAIYLSLLEKIAEYTQYLRRSFLGESSYQRSLSANNQLNRRLVKAAHDLLWLLGDKQDDDSSLVCHLKGVTPGMLEQEHWKFLSRLANPRYASSTSADLSDNFSLTRFVVMEKIYKAAQQVVYSSPSSQ